VPSVEWNPPLRLMIEQSRPRDREIDDFDALHADGAGELPIGADGILPGDSACL